MNRTQAGHILDAYTDFLVHTNKEAADALREIILDAMTQYKNEPKLMNPGITLTGADSYTYLGYTAQPCKDNPGRSSNGPVELNLM